MHLTALLFNHMAGVNIALVPYRGSGPVVTDVAAGHIPLGVGDMTSGLAVIRAGQVKPLGVSSRKRDPSLPDVPTFAESGLPGYEAMGWFGVIAPAGTPREVIAKLNEAIVSALEDPVSEGTDARGRGGAGSDHPRRVRAVHSQRDRQMGEGDRAIGTQGELIGARFGSPARSSIPARDLERRAPGR